VSVICPVCGSERVRVAGAEVLRQLPMTLQRPRQCETCGSVFQPRARPVRAGALITLGLLVLVGALYDAASDVFGWTIRVSTIVAVLAIPGGVWFVTAGVRYWRLRRRPIVHYLSSERRPPGGQAPGR
jgi:hypothetical protein